MRLAQEITYLSIFKFTSAMSLYLFNLLNHYLSSHLGAVNWHFMFVSPPFSWERCEWIYVLCRELGNGWWIQVDGEKDGAEGVSCKNDPTHCNTWSEREHLHLVLRLPGRRERESGREGGKDNSWMARKTQTCKHSSLGCSVLRAQSVVSSPPCTSKPGIPL